MKPKSIKVVPFEQIHGAIFEIRQKKVMLDSHLASLYEVKTKVLNRAVQRNIERFPEDFMFQLTEEEVEALRCQLGTSKNGRGGRRYLPYVFTEHGILILSSVLTSSRAIHVNIEIMRAFIRMREFILSHEIIAKKLDALERRYDSQFKVVFNSIRDLINTKQKNQIDTERNKKVIGFARNEKNKPLTQASLYGTRLIMLYTPTP